jgi:hypothetical protein
MNKIINETLINSIKKTNYYNFFIKQKKENKKIQKNNDDANNKKIKLIQRINLSPLTLSFDPEEKNTKINLFNKIEKNAKNINILNNKFTSKKKYNLKGKIKLIKNRLSFSKVSTNNTFESNNERKINVLINGLNPDKNNLIIQHKKIDFSNFINYPLNTNKKNQIKNQSYIEFGTSKKYKTILTKCNTNLNDDTKKRILEEPNIIPELFSSKYNKKNKKEEKKFNENSKLFQNEEIKKAEFYKFDSCLEKNKYSMTETSSNINSIFLKNTKNANFSAGKKVKVHSINNLYKPIYYYKKKNRIKNLKLILQKIKNNPIDNIPIFTKYLNNKKDISLDNTPFNKNKIYKNYNGVKYSPINLNMFAKIPNRIMPIDNHGNEYNGPKNNKKKSIKNTNNLFNVLKQSFADIKILRKQFLDIYHSNQITRNNSKKTFDNDNNTKITVSKNRMFKTFYKNNQKILCYDYKSNKKNFDLIYNRNYYFLSEE